MRRWHRRHKYTKYFATIDACIPDMYHRGNIQSVLHPLLCSPCCFALGLWQGVACYSPQKGVPPLLVVSGLFEGKMCRCSLRRGLTSEGYNGESVVRFLPQSQYWGYCAQQVGVSPMPG